jgi:peptidoglycan/LPS O-acetylase OafA/YrhL
VDIVPGKISRLGPGGGTETLVQPSEEIKHTNAYRPEIDGLRAVAVIPVVLFHAGIRAFNGGFVGVDVFFVISGYLITGLLYRECINGEFSIARFYERRIRRIFPALFFVLLTAVVAGLVLMVPAELATLGRRIAATTLFVSNIFYWRHSGYFDEASASNALLHTWSLAVEEQFYIFFPIGLWLLFRWRVKLLPALAFIAAVSFALSVYELHRNPTATFFLLPTRAWELMMGGMLALAPTYRGRFAAVVAGAGISAIFAAVLLYWQSMPFPGPAALLPCAGAAAFVAVTGDQCIGRILASGLFRGIGLISYSLYLWHRPLFVFAEFVVGRPLSAIAMVVLIALSFILAIGSWYFVEQPIRRWRSRLKLWILGISCILAGLIISAPLILTNGLPARYSPAARAMLAKADKQLDAQKAAYSCGHDQFAHNVGPCPIGVPGKPELLVIGDSHAMALRDALNEAATDAKIPARLIAVQGCPPLLGFRRLQYPTRCDRREATIFQYVRSTRPKAVLLVASWGHVLFDTDSLVAGHMSKDDVSRLGNVTTALSATMSKYRQLGIRVGILLPIPGARESVARNLARGMGAPLTYSERDHRARFAPFKEVLVRLHPTALADAADVFCKRVCKVEERGQPLYIDDNHVNRAGEKVVEPVLRKLIRQLIYERRQAIRPLRQSANSTGGASADSNMRVARGQGYSGADGPRTRSAVSLPGQPTNIGHSGSGPAAMADQ